MFNSFMSFVLRKLGGPLSVNQREVLLVWTFFKPAKYERSYSLQRLCRARPAVLRRGSFTGAEFAQDIQAKLYLTGKQEVRRMMERKENFGKT